MAIQAPADVESQYRALREGVGLVERARGQLDVAGPDAVEYLQAQLTNDVAALAPGGGCYAALLNPKGRILADMRILLREPGLVWIDSEPVAFDGLRSKLEMYKIGRQVEVAERTAERAVLSLIGPATGRALGADVPAGEHSWIDVDLDGTPAVAVATGEGADVVVAAEDAGRIRSTLEGRGAVPVEEGVAEIVRVEGGRPRYGIDMDADNLPGEVGLDESAVSFTKGCYVGQEPVARMRWRGHPNRRLRGLVLSAPVTSGEALRASDREVGRIGSAYISPALGPIALAVVRREVAVGDELGLESGATGRVVELPFSRG